MNPVVHAALMVSSIASLAITAPAEVGITEETPKTPFQ